MLRRKTVIVGFLALCLTAALFIGVTKSGNQNGIRDYDPCCDVNDDGIIDIVDIVILALKYETIGTPFVAKAGLEYDSEWLNITNKCGQYFNIIHNLSTTDIMVDIQGKTTMDGGVHQRHLGLTGYKPGWSRTYGGVSYDRGFSVVQTSDGGYAIAGYTPSFGAEGLDSWLVKTDSVGNVQWNQTYGGASTDSANSVVETSDGGYAMTGQTASFGAGDFDLWLVKTDSAGNVQWNQTYGGEEHGDHGKSVVETSDGGYAIAGYTASFGAGGYDFWLVKTNATGNVQWNQTYGGASAENAWSVVQTGDGGYAIAGRTASFGAGDYDFWLVKTNSTGNVQWNQTYGGTNEELAFSVVETSDGGYAIAGETNSFGAGDVDFWLVKTDSAGNVQWNQTYGGASGDHGKSVVETSDGGYAIAGHTESFGAGDYDFWLVKTDSTGNVQWNQTYGGTSTENAYSLIQTSDTGYAIAGNTESFGAGDVDFWLVKTHVESGLAWTDSTANTITLYRGATDPYWNYVRVRIWKICEDP